MYRKHSIKKQRIKKVKGLGRWVIVVFTTTIFPISFKVLDFTETPKCPINLNLSELVHIAETDVLSSYDGVLAELHVGSTEDTVEDDVVVHKEHP